MSFTYRVFRKIKNIIYKKYISIFYKNIRIGKNFKFRKSFIINCRGKAQIVIGDNVFFNNYCSLNSHDCISIGNDCIFGESVKIYDHNHNFDNKNMKIHEQGFKSNEVKIGHNCWIGSNVIILPGTIIGNNVVIGAGIVLKGTIPDNCIVTQERKYNIKKIINK